MDTLYRPVTDQRIRMGSAKCTRESEIVSLESLYVAHLNWTVALCLKYEGWQSHMQYVHVFSACMLYLSYLARICINFVPCTIIYNIQQFSALFVVLSHENEHAAKAPHQTGQASSPMGRLGRFCLAVLFQL